QLQDQLDVLFIDTNGTMRVTWVTGTGKWSDGAEGRPGPAQTTNFGLFPKDARLAAAKQNGNRLDAFGVSHDGAVHMTWVDGAGRWADSDRPPLPMPIRLSRALWMRDWVAWPHIHGTPVFATFGDGSALVYVWPEKDHLKSIPWTGAKLDESQKR